MYHRLCHCLALVCAIGLSLSGTAAAQPQPQPQPSPAVQQAIKHFEEGVRLKNAGDCEAAIPEFEASREFAPNPKTEMNLARCYEALQDLVTAHWYYREAQRLAEERGDADIAKDAAAAAEALEMQLGRLRLIIKAPAQPDSSEVTITRNGERVAVEDLGEYIVVAPGEAQRIVASADGYRSYETTAQVGAGESETVEILPLERILIVEPPPRNTRRFLGIACVGAGTAVVLGGLGVGWAAKSARDDAFDSGACNSATLLCTLDGQAKMDRAHDRALYSTILVSAGVLVAAGGAALWLTAPKQRQARESSALMPLLSPEHVGVALSGRF